jgi:hypothetical protein
MTKTTCIKNENVSLIQPLVDKGIIKVRDIDTPYITYKYLCCQSCNPDPISKDVRDNNSHKFVDYPDTISKNGLTAIFAYLGFGKAQGKQKYIDKGKKLFDAL